MKAVVIHNRWIKAKRYLFSTVGEIGPPISTSVKRLGEQLQSKANFSTFLELSCSNFRLKMCEGA